MEYHVDRVELEELPTAVVRGSIMEEADVAAFLGGAYGEVMDVLAAQGLQPAGPPFGRYAFSSEGVEVEAGFPTSGPVAPTGRVEASTLPGGPTVVVLHRGAYEAVVDAYEAAKAWMAEHEWEESGPPWEAYLDGPEVAAPRTVVHVPARPR